MPVSRVVSVLESVLKLEREKSIVLVAAGIGEG